MRGESDAAQHVVPTVEDLRFFDGLDVCRILDDAEHRVVAARVPAITARLGIGEVAAHAAPGHPVMQGGRGTSEGFGTLPSSLEQVERDSLRGFFSDPGSRLSSPMSRDSGSGRPLIYRR